MGGQGGAGPVADLEVEEHAEEGLVGRGEQQRPAERGQPVRRAAAGEADWAAVLPRSRPASTMIRLSGMPAARAWPARSDQELGHLLDHVVVVRDRGRGCEAPSRMWVATTAAPAAAAAAARIAGIGEAADVVADDGAGPIGLAATDARQVSTDSGTSKRSSQAGDRRHDPVQLLGLASPPAPARP